MCVAWTAWQHSVCDMRACGARAHLAAGTLPQGAREEVRRLVEGGNMYIDKLVALAVDVGFDGWLVNVEVGLPTRAMASKLRTTVGTCGGGGRALQGCLPA